MLGPSLRMRKKLESPPPPGNALYQSCTNSSTLPNKRASRAQDDKYYKQHLTTGPNSYLYHRNVPHNASCQTCRNSLALLNKRAARPLDKTYI